MVLSMEPYWRVIERTSFSGREKYTYICELSDTLIRGSVMDELTRAPTLMDVMPAEPFTGLFTMA